MATEFRTVCRDWCGPISCSSYGSFFFSFFFIRQRTLFARNDFRQMLNDSASLLLFSSVRMLLPKQMHKRNEAFASLSLVVFARLFTRCIFNRLAQFPCSAMCAFDNALDTCDSKALSIQSSKAKPHVRLPCIDVMCAFVHLFISTHSQCVEWMPDNKMH